MRIVDIAKICHEANRAYCEALGDTSQLPWEDAPGWQRQSAVNGVKFNLENPNAPASHSHDNWLAEKLEQGWIFGPEKNPELKQHPCCVPYESLPETQKRKDHLFKAIVNALAPLIGG